MNGFPETILPATKARVLEHGETGAQEGPPVLVATDGSEVSLRAGGYAARLAGGLGAKLFALYVVDEHLAESGIRVLGVGIRRLGSFDEDDLERDLTFFGMVGMIDPARPEAKDAVKTCKRAGIRPVMITGDHPLTARAIATELGIADAGTEGEAGRILTGRDFAGMGEGELKNLVEEVSVYARVSPENKLDIVDALQDNGHIVAMTGDGVNDAPALRKADIGVAMGITGTDVSKEASDMVLTDDNFATIVAAVEQGRVIYDNIRKFIKYLLTSNSAEILVMLVGPFLGLPLPLLPLQILWINLVTDGPPALAPCAAHPTLPTRASSPATWAATSSGSGC
jgi:Ca2+-transporting ATPase